MRTKRNHYYERLLSTLLSKGHVSSVENLGEYLDSQEKIDPVKCAINRIEWLEFRAGLERAADFFAKEDDKVPQERCDCPQHFRLYAAEEVIRSLSLYGAGSLTR